MSGLITKIFLVSGSTKINGWWSIFCKLKLLLERLIGSYSIKGVLTREYSLLIKISSIFLDTNSSLCASSGSNTLKPSGKS